VKNFAKNPRDAAMSGSFSFNDTSLQFTVVPEPHAAIIGGIGMLMLLRRRRSALA
jgi:hypothetical protein